LSFKAFALSGWDQMNDPELMKIDYERNFSQLPLAGELTKKPWNGNYWPTYRGGITYRWNQPPPEAPSEEHPRYHFELLNFAELQNLKALSPAEKYDLYMGQESWPLTTYEKKRTKINMTDPNSDDYDPDLEIPRWEGLCHAWAPAALLYHEPGPVTIVGLSGKKVHFGASDIKALLIYFLHSNRSKDQTKTKFLGTRCYLDFKKYEEQLADGEITQEEFDRAINSTSCADINAGAFHMVLTNQIGLLDEGFVADVFRDIEVWNYPVHWFESKIIEETMGASVGAAKGTVKEVRIVTLLKHAYSIEQSWFPMGDLENRYFEGVYGKKKYEYRVELDKKGNIIGGEWISKNRPDFVWKQSLPAFRGYFKPLKEIYEKSMNTLKDIQKFWQAIDNNDLEAIKYLLREININVQNGDGDTPLHLAVRKNHLEIIHFLIKKGADLNLANNIGKSPLHLAAGLGSLELTKILIGAGATLDIRDLSGQSPFHLATWGQHFKTIAYLIEKGCDINAQDSNGKTSLHWAALRGNDEITNFLISNKAMLDIKDHSGKTPFYWSILKNKTPVTIALIKAGAKLDIKDDKGMAPIHIATFKGYPHLVKLILDNKGDVNITENSGKTPLHMAVIEGNMEIITLLIASKAEINPIDNFNKTPLNYVLGFPEIEKLLKDLGGNRHLTPS